MPSTSTPMRPPPARVALVAALAHALIWTLLPPLYLGNLHSDTVEAISWATHWDWGYFKHPPVVTWLFKLILDLPGSRLLNLLALSQMSVLISAALIWRAVRIYATEDAALAGVFVYLASPPATYFAVQVNHNSLAIPFGAAIFLFGLRFLEHRRGVDALLLGLVAGAGLMTKYQTAFFLITLIVVALATPRFRGVWLDWRGYAAAALALAIVAPHLLWDSQHGWRTLLYASADRPLRTLGDVGASLNELLDGLLMWLVGPLLAWLVLARPRIGIARTPQARLGALLVACPVAIIAALGFASGQVLRQGWLIPMIPALAIGLPLMLTLSPRTGAPAPALLRSPLLSFAQALAFAAFLFGRTVSGSPVTAYSLDGAELTRNVLRVWAQADSRPLPCVIMPNRSYALSMMLHLPEIPDVHDMRWPPYDSGAFDECAATGGVLILPENQRENADIRALGMTPQTVEAPPWPWGGAYRWRFNVYRLEQRAQAALPNR